MSWSHNALAEDLAQHLRGNTDRMVWTDMQLGPAGSPRPDVYTIQKSYAKFTPLAYECKISVADFRSDVTSGKWQKYLKFAAGVIFAVPKGLVTRADVPPGCGLMTRNENGWVSVKGPTLARIQTLPHDAFMKLLIDGVARSRRIDPEARRLKPWAVQKAIREQYGEGIAIALSDRDSTAQRLRNEAHRNEDEISRVRDLHRINMQKLTETLKREARIVDEAREQLCKALGIHPEAGAYEISNAIREIRKSLTADDEVRRMREQLVSARRSIKFALESVSEESPLEAAANNNSISAEGT